MAAMTGWLMAAGVQAAWLVLGNAPLQCALFVVLAGLMAYVVVRS